ncbi:MAG: VOC family protein [Bacteroidota bacterium]
MRIDHVAIWTQHLEQLRQFYETYFDGMAGAKYTNTKKNFESYFLTFASGANLELMYMPTIPENKNDIEAQYTGIIHLAFATGSMQRVDDLTARLKKDGFRVIDGPRRTGDGYYESVVLDPEGNRIEITV